jgi:hypothetical protein
VAIHDHRFEPVEIHVLQKVDGKAVDVTYKGGEKKITIRSNIPIVGLVPSEDSDALAAWPAALPRTAPPATLAPKPALN